MKSNQKNYTYKEGEISKGVCISISDRGAFGYQALTAKQDEINEIRNKSDCFLTRKNFTFENQYF
jgi:hypothetical protein